LSKNIKKNVGILIVGFLVLIFIFNQNLVRKFYNIINFDYESRISKSGGYCSDDSVGYLRYLKKKYDFKFNPTVINYEDSVPNSNWAIYDTRLKDDNTHKVLLNYRNKLFLKFEPSVKNFYSKNTVKYSSGISEIYFDLKVQSINLSSNLTIYRKNFGIKEKEIIYSKFFDEIIKNNESIKIDYDTKKINNIYKPTFLEINNLDKEKINKINSITLVLKNEFDLNNFQILNNYGDCYYVR
tara:strand:+ start:35 stop:754 length:720 start_codon:yes stop_codon:yes gene_type:complete